MTGGAGLVGASDSVEHGGQYDVVLAVCAGARAARALTCVPGAFGGVRDALFGGHGTRLPAALALEHAVCDA